MGLISWIKDTYYNHKLDNADSAYHAKDFSKAERIYQEILDKQPDAAGHLAKMYYEVGKFHNNELSYLAKLKSLLSNTSIEKNKVSTYLNQLVSYIEKVAEQLFKNQDYNNAYKYLKSIEPDKRGDTNFAKKSRLYALYVNLYTIETESSYTSYLGVLDTYCKKVIEKEIEDAIIGTVKRLHDSHKLDRAYCISDCLAKNGNSKAVKECVSIANDIYKKGKKSDIKVIDEDSLLDYISITSQSNLLAGLEKFAKFSDKYRCKYISEGISVITSESDVKKSFYIFKKVWETAPDVSLIQTFAKSSSTIATPVYKYFEENITSLNSDSKYKIALFNELNAFENTEYILSILEKFKDNGLDNKELYVSKVKSFYKTLGEESRLSLINRLLRYYCDDKWGIGEKFAIGERAQVAHNYTLSIQLYSELVGSHAKAQPRLAQLYYELSLKESDFSKRRSLLEKAFSFKKSHDTLFDSKEYDRLVPGLTSSALDLVKESFANNTPEDAYVTATIFKPFISNCFVNYVQELKSYHDIAYVLAKLESLKNEGCDVESDYKEIVNKIASSSDYEDKYKLTVLSKSIDLYKDEKLSEKFIETSIGVIQNESEAEGAVSIFSKTWMQLADSLLLEAFVNQEYKYHKFIVDFLIEKSSISRWKRYLVSDFCDQIFAFDDYEYSLSVFDRIASKGIDVQKAYVACVLKALPSLGTDDRLLLLNKSLNKYSDKYLIDEKLNLCDAFIDDGKVEVAENILLDLVGLHESAEPKLAALYYKESEKAESFESKLDLLRKGLSYHTSHSNVFANEEYEPIFKKLLSAFTSIIYKYYSNKEYYEAYRLCEELKLYSDEWYSHYLRLRMDALSSLDCIEDKINHIRETFNTLNVNGYIVKESTLDEINSLWDVLHELEVRLAKTKSYQDCLQQFKDYSTYVANHCNEDKSISIQKNINEELISIHKSHGYKSEKGGLYSDAISSYVALSSIADIRTKTWCKVRCVICNIKDGKLVEEEEVRKILAYVGFAKEKKDLAYRYSLYLIANKGAKESISFVNEYLPEESDLVALCNNEYIKEAETLLGKLNQVLDRLRNGTATLSEAESLSESLEEYDNSLSPYLDGVHSKIVSIRPAIQSYILSRCFEEGNFEKALKYLKATGKNWYEDDVYFRNVAIACLGIAENGKLNKSNYKAIISCWLTAVYRDQLFVKSLDYTTWDDPYTFTLENSLGGSKFDSYDSLPDNVGFDKPIEGSVISISEVQQRLLNRFEVALNDKDDIFREFFEEQKDAMDSLVRLNMDTPCIIASPYLANTTRKCLNEIKETLDYEYDNYGGENILKVGILYNINSGVYSDYKDATCNAKSCVAAAKSMSVTQVKGAFAGSVIDSIKEFSELYGSFVTEIQNVLSQVTKSGASYKSVLKVFSIICQALNDSTLAYIFGNYINQSIVGKLNDENLDLVSGLNDLVSAYKVAKSCTQLKNSVGYVLEALVGKYITEANSNDLVTIKSVLASTGTEFEQKVVSALSQQALFLAVATDHMSAIDNLALLPARSSALRNRLSSIKQEAIDLKVNIELAGIADGIEKKTMTSLSALQKAYALYGEHRDNKVVCKLLVFVVGLCIMEYCASGKLGVDSVNVILNKLKYNKSTAYKTVSSQLLQMREDELKKYPYELRNLLEGGSSSSTALNAKGIKLKNALQLFVDLS